MKQAYLVRLRYVFRSLRDRKRDTYTKSADTNQAIFWNRVAAERFAATNRPRAHNPFDTTNYGFWRGWRDETLLFHSDSESSIDGDEDAREISQRDWHTFLAEQGIPFPTEITNSEKERVAFDPHTEGHDALWWNEIVPQLSEDQIMAVWKFVFPLPFEIVEIAVSEE